MNKQQKISIIKNLMNDKNTSKKTITRVIELRGANYPYTSIYDKLVKGKLI